MFPGGPGLPYFRRTPPSPQAPPQLSERTRRWVEEERPRIARFTPWIPSPVSPQLWVKDEPQIERDQTRPAVYRPRPPSGADPLLNYDRLTPVDPLTDSQLDAELEYAAARGDNPDDFVGGDTLGHPRRVAWTAARALHGPDPDFNYEGSPTSPMIEFDTGDAVIENAISQLNPVFFMQRTFHVPNTLAPNASINLSQFRTIMEELFKENPQFEYVVFLFDYEWCVQPVGPNRGSNPYKMPSPKRKKGAGVGLLYRADTENNLVQCNLVSDRCFFQQPAYAILTDILQVAAGGSESINFYVLYSFMQPKSKYSIDNLFRYSQSREMFMPLIYLLLDIPSAYNLYEVYPSLVLFWLDFYDSIVDEITKLGESVNPKRVHHAIERGFKRAVDWLAKPRVDYNPHELPLHIRAGEEGTYLNKYDSIEHDDE